MQAARTPILRSMLTCPQGGHASEELMPTDACLYFYECTMCRAMLALLAAVLFGISTPLVQRFGADIGAFSTAALLYGGAALVGALSGATEAARAAAYRANIAS